MTPFPFRGTSWNSTHPLIFSSTCFPYNTPVSSESFTLFTRHPAPGSKKNGTEYRGLPGELRTRWYVAWNLWFETRLIRSPMFTTMLLGTYGAGIHSPLVDRTSKPPVCYSFDGQRYSRRSLMELWNIFMDDPGTGPQDKTSDSEFAY